MLCDFGYSAIHSKRLLSHCQLLAKYYTYTVTTLASCESFHNLNCAWVFSKVSHLWSFSILSSTKHHLSVYICLSYKQSLSISGFISLHLTVSPFLSFPSSISLSFSHQRQFQFHIDYIFNSINPIRNWTGELPEDKTAKNMFHNQSSA